MARSRCYLIRINLISMIGLLTRKQRLLLLYRRRTSLQRTPSFGLSVIESHNLEILQSPLDQDQSIEDISV